MADISAKTVAGVDETPPEWSVPVLVRRWLAGRTGRG
jgi:hypothetical protein